MNSNSAQQHEQKATDGKTSRPDLQLRSADANHRYSCRSPGFYPRNRFLRANYCVGLSKLRHTDVKRPAALAEKFDETCAGLWLFNTEDNSEIGQIKFTGNVEQIYDIAVLRECHFPELIEPSHPRMRNHFCHPMMQPLDA